MHFYPHFSATKVSIGDTLDIKCNDSGAEVGSTLKDSLTLLCLPTGNFSPNLTLDVYKCEEPLPCPAENLPNPDPESGLIFKNESSPILAYRYAKFVCNESEFITDFGYEILSLCGKDGNFDDENFANLSAITCREPLKCPDYVPYPTMESGLADSESVVEKEGQIAVFKCLDSPKYLIEGK